MRIFFLTFFISIMSFSLSAEIVRTISVTGLAEKTFQPDIVSVNLNVWGKGASAKEAQKNNSLRFEQVKKVLNDFKLKKEDIKTTSYDLNPDYVYDQKTNKNTIQGYNCNQGLSVTIRGVDQVGPFLDQLVVDQKKEMSGLNVNNLLFDLDQRSAEEKLLTSEAVKNALDQAMNLAAAAGVKIKGVYRLVPRGAQVTAPVFGDVMMESTPMLKQKSVGTTIMSGEVKVTGEVSVDYLIE